MNASQLMNLLTLRQHMEDVFHLHYSSERGKLLERERSALLGAASNLSLSVRKLLDLVGPEGQGYKELTPLNEDLRAAITDLKEYNTRCVVRRNTIDAAIQYLCRNAAFGEPLQRSQLNEVCRGHVCLTIPHVSRDILLEPEERDDLLDSLRYPLSWLFNVPNESLVSVASSFITFANSPATYFKQRYQEVITMNLRVKKLLLVSMSLDTVSQQRSISVYSVMKETSFGRCGSKLVLYLPSGISRLCP